jgi:hypothetical protein
MTDPTGSLDIDSGKPVLQRTYLPGYFLNGESTIALNRDSCRVIAPVLQAFEPLYQKGYNMLLTDVTDYSTQVTVLLTLSRLVRSSL